MNVSNSTTSNGNGSDFSYANFSTALPSRNATLVMGQAVAAVAVVVGLPLQRGTFAFIRFTIMELASLMSFIGNGLTVWAVLSSDKLRVKTYALTTALAVSDIILASAIMHYVIHDAVTYTS